MAAAHLRPAAAAADVLRRSAFRVRRLRRGRSDGLCRSISRLTEGGKRFEGDDDDYWENDRVRKLRIPGTSLNVFEDKLVVRFLLSLSNGCV